MTENEYRVLMQNTLPSLLLRSFSLDIYRAIVFETKGKN